LDSKDKEKKLLLGVDLGGTDTKLGLVSSQGEIIEQAKIPTLGERGGEDTLRRIALALDDLLQRHSLKRSDVRGIGFGSPGPLSTSRGVVIDTPNLGWVNVPVRALLEDLMTLPVVLHNDANAAAYGEFWRGAGRGSSIMVLYTLGTGVGGGICMFNDLLVGPGENAGELGHMVIDYKGPKCPCGHIGCLEAHAAAKAVVRDTLAALDAGETSSLRHLARGTITARRVFEAARDGDGLARRIFHNVGWCLGLASGNLINVLNAEMFVFGGAMSGAWEILYDAILEGARASCIAMPVENVRFVRAELGENAGIIGAAGLALKEFGQK
jgi:glucokinase